MINGTGNSLPSEKRLFAHTNKSGSESTLEVGHIIRKGCEKLKLFGTFAICLVYFNVTAGIKYVCDVCSRFGSVFCLYVSSECRAEGWIDKYGAAEWVVYMPGTSLPNYSDKQKYVRLFCSKPNRLRLFLFAPKPTLCSSLSGSLLSLPISVSSTFGSTTDARIIDKRIYVVWAKSKISSAFPCDVTMNVYSYNLLYRYILSVYYMYLLPLWWSKNHC